MKKIECKSMGINIELEKNLTSIIGNSNSGKTYFLKKLINRVNNDDIFIDGINIRDFDVTFLMNNIFVCLNDDNFKCEYVAEELFYYLNILGFSIEEITKKIKEIIKYFHLDNLENKTIDRLPINTKIMIKILSMLIVKPSIIAFDNLFPYLTQEQIDLIIKYIKKNNICLINVINDGKYLKYTDRVVVLNEKKAIYDGTTKELLASNSILPYLGLRLPFTFELSSNLMIYGLVDKVYYDNSKLVRKLWK